jgi:hypothetical protein
METKRQALLKRVRDDYCDGKTSVLAERIGQSYSYVHRLFYDTDKKGHKGVGLAIMEACSAAFNLPIGFWEDGNERPALATPPQPDALNSPYARLLANTFDALRMPPDVAKQAFLAATQVLIDHSLSCTAPTMPAQKAAALAASTLPEPQDAPTAHSSRA